MSQAKKTSTIKRSQDHPLYVNRELSWLEFNSRVLAEASKKSNPILERLKFLAIFESNLDEFYMVRVSGLIEQADSGVEERTPDGVTPAEQLELIAVKAHALRRLASKVWTSELAPGLAKAGINILKYKDLAKERRQQLDQHFVDAVFPLCTPLLLEPTTTFPFISNRSLNLAVELKDGPERKLARVKIPPNIPRALRLGNSRDFILLEDLIANHLHLLFPGVQVVGSHLFRVVRDADIEIRELESADLIAAIEQTIKLRRFGDPVLLEVSPSLPEPWCEVLQRGLKLEDSDTFLVDSLIGMDVLWELADLPRGALKFPPHPPFVNETLTTSNSLFETIRHQDVLLHHPYDGFAPVQEFVASAANDPKTIGIKQTLYRVGAQSPIVEALLEGAEEGKQVAVMVELKARFDENNNLVWSRALERAGVHVTYGVPETKVHCKLCLVVRKEPGGIRTYVHVGTGNYNPSTARLYTDIGLMTCDPDICQDVTELFNVLTGYAKQSHYRKLLVAPSGLREGILERIEREEQIHLKHGGGRIMLKVNSMVDPEVIDALYSASRAGVQVDLVVRGICCLRPGVKGMSENIRVISIVGRFLEHSRIYYFGNGGKPEAFIGSADVMRRNLDRRVEVLAPVEDPRNITYLREVIECCLRDNTQAWRMEANGQYSRVAPKKNEEPTSAQSELMKIPATKNLRPRKAKRV